VTYANHQKRHVKRYYNFIVYEVKEIFKKDYKQIRTSFGRSYFFADRNTTHEFLWKIRRSVNNVHQQNGQGFFFERVKRNNFV
jgi:hypothetical protein